MKTLALVLLAVVLVSVCSAKANQVCDSDKGEEYQSCGTACPDTCSNYDTVRPCIMQCVPGCFCPRGTVRRESDDQCVDTEDC